MQGQEPTNLADLDDADLWEYINAKHGAKTATQIVRHRQRMRDRQHEEERESHEQTPMDSLKSGIQKTLQGASFGFNDEIGGAIRAAVDHRNGGSFKERYEKNRDAIREGEQQFDAENPKSGLGLEMLGGLMSGSGPASRFGRAAAGSIGGKEAAHIVANAGMKEAAKDIGHAAMFGAGAGAGNAEGGLEDRLHGAGSGALIGGLTGGILKAVGTGGKIASNLIGKRPAGNNKGILGAIDRMIPFRSERDKVGEDVGKRLFNKDTGDGLDYDAYRQRMMNTDRPLTHADAGKNTTGALVGIAKSAGPLKNEILEAFEGRNRGAAERVEHDLIDNVPDRVRDHGVTTQLRLRKLRDVDGDNAFTDVFSGHPLKQSTFGYNLRSNSKVLEPFMKGDKDFIKAYEKATEELGGRAIGFQGRLVPIPTIEQVREGKGVPLQVLDKIRRQMRDAPKSLKDEDYWNKFEMWKQDLLTAAPTDYADAISHYADQSRGLEEYKKAFRTFNRKRAVDMQDDVKRINDTRPGAKPFYNQGVIDRIVAQIKKGSRGANTGFKKLFDTPEMEDKLRVLFAESNDEGAGMVERRNAGEARVQDFLSKIKDETLMHETGRQVMNAARSPVPNESLRPRIIEHLGDMPKLILSSTFGRRLQGVTQALDNHEAELLMKGLGGNRGSSATAMEALDEIMHRAASKKFARRGYYQILGGATGGRVNERE